MGYRNDVSFVIGGDTFLWEHQSTTNPNMPLRGLMYFTLLYRRYLDSTDQSELSSRLVPLPTPRYYVFYNGTDDRPDREVLSLSGSFVNARGEDSARASARAETLEHVAKAVRGGELSLSAATSFFGFTEEEASASL